MSVVPPSSKSAQSNLGRRIAFAAGRMKVVIRRLAPHAKFSENGNVGHSVSSWMVKALNNILDDLIGRLRETVPIKPLGFYSGDLITVNMDYSNNTYYVCVANGKVKVPLSSNDTPSTITLERAIELLASKR